MASVWKRNPHQCWKTGVDGMIAMQKVVCSSPISRFGKCRQSRDFLDELGDDAVVVDHPRRVILPARDCANLDGMNDQNRLALGAQAFIYRYPPAERQVPRTKHPAQDARRREIQSSEHGTRGESGQ
jgi:hypothetical protein